MMSLQTLPQSAACQTTLASQVSSQVVFLACMQAGSSQALICKTCVQLLSSIYSNKVTSYMNGHDHAMAVGNPQQDNVQQA